MNDDFWGKSIFEQSKQTSWNRSITPVLREQDEPYRRLLGCVQSKNKNNQLQPILEKIPEYKKGLILDSEFDLYLKGLKGLATNPDDTSDFTPLQKKDDYFVRLLDEIVGKRGDWTEPVQKNQLIADFEEAWLRSSKPDDDGDINISDESGYKESAEIKKPIDIVILETLVQIKSWGLNPLPFLEVLPMVQFGSFNHDSGRNFPYDKKIEEGQLVPGFIQGLTLFPGRDYDFPTPVPRNKEFPKIYHPGNSHKILLRDEIMELLKAGKYFRPQSADNNSTKYNKARIEMIKYLENFSTTTPPKTNVIEEGRLVDQTDIYCISTGNYAGLKIIKPHIITIIHEFLHVINFESKCFNDELLTSFEERFVARTSKLIQMIALVAKNTFGKKFETQKAKRETLEVLSTLNFQTMEKAAVKTKGLLEVLTESSWDTRYKDCLIRLNITKSLIDGFCRQLQKK